MKKKDMTRINNFDEFLDTFDKGGDVLRYAADGKTHTVGQDWFASKLADASTPLTTVEISTPAYKVACEKAGAHNLTVSQFISNLLIDKVAAQIG